MSDMIVRTQDCESYTGGAEESTRRRTDFGTLTRVTEGEASPQDGHIPNYPNQEPG